MSVAVGEVKMWRRTDFIETLNMCDSTFSHARTSMIYCTTASERYFPTLCRLKSYLHNSMSENSLNGLYHCSQYVET
ncbi:hypothetical protein PR048_029338 [Dryococelus australis]|uniref:Uncharacterized protein n=1 Tax=Dryococelus australis TaxID=614101 RepID=A0ABQ9GDQ9_9NEOP|nr:hypothetical protein PR048_029338 [Dryococelus australis]